MNTDQNPHAHTEDFSAQTAKGDELSGRWQPLPDGPAWSDAEGWNQPQYYTTIQAADIDGDGDIDDDRAAELIARAAAGITAWKCDPNTHQWHSLPDGPAWNDTGNWNQPQYYTTIQAADIDGDRKAELIARAAAGIVISKYDPDTRQWNSLPDGPLWSDAEGWNQPQYYTTIQAADIDGDRKAELIARAAAGITGFKYVPAAGG